MEMGVEPIPEIQCISNIPQTTDSFQHSVLIMNQPLSLNFRESFMYCMVNVYEKMNKIHSEKIRFQLNEKLGVVLN
jgi:hypothetical protein